MDDNIRILLKGVNVARYIKSEAFEIYNNCCLVAINCSPSVFAAIAPAAEMPHLYTHPVKKTPSHTIFRNYLTITGRLFSEEMIAI